jgi:hypothetical protein
MAPNTARHFRNRLIMALQIDTFDNVRGGNILYKGLTHPCAARLGNALVTTLRQNAPVAVYDPGGAIVAFNEIFSLDEVEIAGAYVQQTARIGELILGHRATPVTELVNSSARAVFIAAFDAERMIAQLEPYLPAGAPVFSLDAMRIPADRLTNRSSYLDKLNFATNFAFFRDADGVHTRLVTVNYWSGYGAGPVTGWMTLFAGDGEILAEWCESFEPAAKAIVLDSREIRARFRLPEFCGQLFLHIVGAAGHDIVKYALDTFGDAIADVSGGDRTGADCLLSCTHDANAWPADRYAGLPAPGAGEQVVLWLQNSHPLAIPPAEIGINSMGEEQIVRIPEPIAPFATCAVDIGKLLPDLAWPKQVELRAGKHTVRPRYEIVENSRRRIAHVNVERGDLVPDPELPRLACILGKGYLLPAPVMPLAEWQTFVLPTPMAVCQAELPITALLYDPEGNEILRHPLGRLPRSHDTAVEIDALVGINALYGGYGHVELVYDFSAGGEADGWLHALFRYRHRRSGHAAETSFGAHVFNTIVTYRDEPQSYSGRPPGLTTRLFLRLGEAGYDTLCHLIYPASRPWRPVSTTEIILHDGAGREIARRSLAIPCSGSRLWYYHAGFDSASRIRAGAGAYITIRDTTCRLFGYHGLVGRNGAFSLDHMFGF